MRRGIQALVVCCWFTGIACAPPKEEQFAFKATDSTGNPVHVSGTVHRDPPPPFITATTVPPLPVAIIHKDDEGNVLTTDEGTGEVYSIPPDDSVGADIDVDFPNGETVTAGTVKP